MGKKQNTNWLLIITVILFLLSIGVVVYKLTESANLSSCEYNGKRISHGETVLEEGTNVPCTCTKDGIVICENGSNEDSLVETSFRTDNLKFTYSFLNTLVSEKPDFTKVKTVDISETESELKVVIEREGWCNADLEAPSQVAYYESTPQEIVFSTMSAFEESVHTKNCLMSNTFVVSPFESEKEEGYSVYYKNEEGKKIDLKACLYDGVLFGSNDVFSGSVEKQICTCNDGSVKCE